MTKKTPSIFISYAHANKNWMDRLVQQLKFLKLNLSPWSDQKIAGGDKWKSQIRDAMTEADLAVLLISADFLSSEFINKYEIPRLLERFNKDEIRIYPIIVSPCLWERVDWLESLQCRPVGGKPLSSYADSAVDEPLMQMAGEIADLLTEDEAVIPETPPVDIPKKPSVKKPPDKKSPDVAELLKLLGGSNVAKAPDNIEQAIGKSLADVDRTLAEISDAKHRLGLDDVNHVTSVAVGHGAGIYNHSHSGRVGCGRIYHLAASGIIGLVPRVEHRLGEQPAIGVDLAIQWLSRIVLGSPLVREKTADDLAWELRFAFDSIHHISQFDDLHEALATASQSGNSLPVVNAILQKAIGHSRKMAEAHVAPYFLRHTAEVLVWLIQSDQLIGSNLNSVADDLADIVAKNPRIKRDNLLELNESLRNRLENAQHVLKAAASSPSDNGHRWYNPSQWFGRN